MPYPLRLALSFMRGPGKAGFNLHIWFSILGIAVGVAFLIFTLVLYDGYVKRLETMVFGFFPHINVVAEDDEEDNFRPSFDLFSDEEKEDCIDICSGAVILESDTADSAPRVRGFSTEKTDMLSGPAKAVPGFLGAGQIILESTSFHVSTDETTSPMLMSMRILGVGQSEDRYIPNIERVIKADAHLNAIKKQADAMLLSVELYEEWFGTAPASDALLHRPFWILNEGEALGQNPREHPDAFRKVQIAGVFRFGVHKIAESMAITNFSLAQQLTGMDNRMTFYGVNLNDPYRAKKASQRLKDEYLEGTMVFHWTSVLGDFFENLRTYRRIIILVLLMSIVITSFNIHNTLSIMILERRRQIGVLRSLGLVRRSIFGIFIWIGLVEATIGSLVGIIAGIGVGQFFSGYMNRELADFLPIIDAGIAVQPLTVFLIVLLVAVICAGTAMFTSRKAIRLDPVECLQVE